MPPALELMVKPKLRIFLFSCHSFEVEYTEMVLVSGNSVCIVGLEEIYLDLEEVFTVVCKRLPPGAVLGAEMSLQAENPQDFTVFPLILLSIFTNTILIYLVCQHTCFSAEPFHSVVVKHFF